MISRDELIRQARETRALAAKAHRLAIGWGNTNPNDVARLIAYAEELDDKARSLERQALEGDLYLPPIGPVVTHLQQQAQQQSDTAPTTQRATPKKELGDPG